MPPLITDATTSGFLASPVLGGFMLTNVITNILRNKLTTNRNCRSATYVKLESEGGRFFILRKLLVQIQGRNFLILIF